MSFDFGSSNAFDKKTIIVVILVGLGFFGWQKYLESKYPSYYQPKTNQAQDPALGAQAVQPPTPPGGQPALSNTDQGLKSNLALSGGDRLLPQSAELFDINTQSWSAKLSSVGMGLTQIKSHTINDRSGQKVNFISDELVFALYEFKSVQPMSFIVQKVSELSFIGTTTLLDGTKIIRQMDFDSSTGAFKSVVRIENKGPQFTGFFINIDKKFKESTGSSFLVPNLDIQEFVISNADETDYVVAKVDTNQSMARAKLLALSTQYFTLAIVDQSQLAPEASIKLENGYLKSFINYNFPNTGNIQSVTQKGFIGSKSFELLNNADAEFVKVVNFGFFSSIGHVLLKLLKFIQNYASNWGLSIIILTFLVRLLVAPFNIMSYKSMKRMQKIQPLLQAAREKYKEDPMALNKETMSIMKNEKVNPLGGCLPMLLQMPIFFALYQVLGQSIELYQAPFFGWITDLSAKDPFYVLPALMGVTMFVQQKLTPTTMDPQQAKILQWMPIVFTLFTLSLPSGLTLYIFISTLFGVLQQQFFMHEKHAS